MTRSVFVMGFDPTHAGFEKLDIDHQLATIKMADRALFDRHSRSEYGPVAEAVSENGKLAVEVNEREVRSGIIELATSSQQPLTSPSRIDQDVHTPDILPRIREMEDRCLEKRRTDSRTSNDTFE